VVKRLNLTKLYCIKLGLIKSWVNNIVYLICSMTSQQVLRTWHMNVANEVVDNHSDGEWVFDAANKTFSTTPLTAKTALRGLVAAVPRTD